MSQIGFLRVLKPGTLQWSKSNNAIKSVLPAHNNPSKSTSITSLLKAECSFGPLSNVFMFLNVYMGACVVHICIVVCNMAKHNIVTLN